MSCTQKGSLRLLIWGHSSGLCLASHLAYSHIWPVSGFFLGQLKGFWEVGRTYYGLASLPFFSPPLELHYPEFLRGQLRTFSAHVGMRKPLDHKRKLLSQGPMLLMASSLKVSTGDCLQQLSLGPVYCLAHIPSQIPGPQGILIGRMKGKGLSSLASLDWHGAHTLLPSWGHRALVLSHQGTRGDLLFWQDLFWGVAGISPSLSSWCKTVIIWKRQT